MIEIDKIQSLLPTTYGEFADTKKTPLVEQGNVAHQFRQLLIEVQQMINTAGLTQGALLYHVEEFKLYALLDYETFGAFLADPEIGIKRRWAFELKAIYKKFVIEFQVPGDRLAAIHISKLGQLLPYVNKKNLEDRLNDAETLSKSALKLKMIGQGDPPGTFGENGGVDNRIPKGCYKLTPISEDDVMNADAIEFANCQIYKDEDGNYLTQVV